MWAASATTPLVDDHTLTIVSRFHGVPGAVKPPHRATTVVPATVTLTAAPTSPRDVKFSAKVPATASNPRSHVPSMRTSLWVVVLTTPCDATKAATVKVGK